MRHVIAVAAAALVLVLAWAGTCVAATATFNKDIAPILYQNCATCHRPGEVAPFSLLTYEDAAKRAKLISVVTQKRYMPPWKAEPGYGSFANERRLTEAQIELIKEYTYDNSGNNPRNPAHPPVRVKWGEQTTDEMALAFLVIALPTPEDAQAFERQIAIQYLEAFLYEGASIENLPSEIPRQQREQLAQVFRLFDRNGNG